MPAGQKQGGFGLVETLIALVLVGTALLLGVSLLWQEHRVHSRLRAQQEAMWAMDGCLELLRAGLLPLRDGALPNVLPEPVNHAAKNLELTLAVTQGAVADLVEVELSASYSVFDQPRTRTVHTQIWNP